MVKMSTTTFQAWNPSPKDTVFPETIPEESSSAEEEHVVIFRLPPLYETDGFLRDPSIYTVRTCRREEEFDWSSDLSSNTEKCRRKIGGNIAQIS